MQDRRRARTLLVAALVTMALGACGNDDGVPTSAAPDAASPAFCDAAFAWHTPPDPEDHEFDQAWFESVLEPRLEDLRTHAPTSLGDELDAIAAALEGGDEAAAQAANARLHHRAVTACGWARYRIDADEYVFHEAPATVRAGVVSFDVANGGVETHMVKIVRRNDGVTMPFTEIVTVPEDRQDELVESFEPEAFVEPGDDGFVVADVTPGDYALICDLPVGSAAGGNEASGVRTHAVEGMVHEFTVQQAKKGETS